MEFNPGELRHRIEFVTKLKSYDSEGSYTTVNAVVYSCRAKVTQVSGTELLKNNADMGEIKIRCLIRTPPKTIGLSRRLALRYDGKDYDVTYINDYGGLRRYTEVWATLRTLEG